VFGRQGGTEGGFDNRYVLGHPSGHDGIDRRQLEGGHTVGGRHQPDHLLRIAAREFQHLGDPAFRRQHDGKPIGPAFGIQAIHQSIRIALDHRCPSRAMWEVYGDSMRASASRSVTSR
jgi:hypothetical protein